MDTDPSRAEQPVTTAVTCRDRGDPSWSLAFPRAWRRTSNYPQPVIPVWMGLATTKPCGMKRLFHPHKTTLTTYIGNMQITVSATAESKLAPTRATVVARVQAQGESAARAIESAKQDCATITQSVESAQSQNALDTWSQAALTTWSNRPWKDDGTQGDPVFYASVLYNITFVDFTVLAEWLASVGEIDTVNIDQVTWRLSDSEVEEATGVVQAQAVTRAHEKAETYARAAGYDSVCFTELADIGLLNNGGATPFGDQGPIMARSAMFKESSGLEVRPEDVVISASVHARFSAKKNV